MFERPKWHLVTTNSRQEVSKNHSMKAINICELFFLPRQDFRSIRKNRQTCFLRTSATNLICKYLLAQAISNVCLCKCEKALSWEAFCTDFSTGKVQFVGNNLGRFQLMATGHDCCEVC